MSGDVKKRMIEKMEVSIDHLKKELSGIRTGRASLVLFDGVQVNYYGTPTPLRQIATLSVPESRLVIIQPWDTTAIPDIEKAILSSGLGLTPSNDGKVIRIGIPLLTEERRKDLVKLVKRLGEECKVAVRNLRRESNDELKALQKEGKLAEDAARKSQDEVQKITDQTVAKVDEILRKKEADILEV